MAALEKPIRAEFQEQGFIILRNLLSDEELRALRAQTDQAITEKIQPILFEQESPEVCAAVPELYKDEQGLVFRRLNRVIERGGAFEQIVCGPLARAAAQILPEPLFVCLNRHNMLMLKAPYNPAPVLWHQDAAVWNEGTFDHLSAIIALDDFRKENGCLEVVPGSHHNGPIGLGWDDNVARIGQEYSKRIDSDAVKVDLKAGDAVLFHGLLLHGSKGNNSEYSRRSLTIAFFPGDLRQISTLTGKHKPEVRQIS
jgi:phytanoyl-CoA hydroxylase